MTKQLTTKQAAALRGVSISTIKAWKKLGLPAKKGGHVLLFSESDVLKFTPNNRGNPHKKR